MFPPDRETYTLRCCPLEKPEQKSWTKHVCAFTKNKPDIKILILNFLKMHSPLDLVAMRTRCFEISLLSTINLNICGIPDNAGSCNFTLCAMTKWSEILAMSTNKCIYRCFELLAHTASENYTVEPKRWTRHCAHVFTRQTRLFQATLGQCTTDDI